MTEKIIVKKIYTDKQFDKKAGKNFNVSSFNKIIKKDTDCYWEDENGEKHVLLKFRKKVIPQKYIEPTREIYEKFSKKGSNEKRDKKFSRSHVTKDNKSINFRSKKSKISGFYDTPSSNHLHLFKTKSVCRTTAFTRDNFDKWKETLPFFETISKLYKKLAPKEYKKQIGLFKKTPPGMQIGKTPFTTITSNYNWRTSLHKDKGDYTQGLGNLTVLGDETFKGGYLGFPQFGIAVDVKPRDFVLMDVHQWHCNTPLKADEKNVRLSFVCYFREKMVDCNKKKIIKGETFYYKE
jgi:hypothetical protein